MAIRVSELAEGEQDIENRKTKQIELLFHVFVRTIMVINMSIVNRGGDNN